MTQVGIGLAWHHDERANSVARSVAEIEADRAARAAARADRYDGRAARAASRSEAAGERAHQMAQAIPFGQPILIGHHSEGRDRRYRDRIHTLHGQEFAEANNAEHWADRAEAARHHQEHRTNVGVTLRRIEKLEAEARKIARQIAGTDSAWSKPAEGEWLDRLERRAGELAEGLAYWREVIAKAEAAGVKVWSRADFAKGDYVNYGGRCFEVLRVNAKSLTVPAIISNRTIIRREGNPRSWSDTLPYNEVHGRKSAPEIGEIIAAAEREADTTG